MKTVTWIVVFALVGSAVVFLWFDGPLRLHRIMHEEKIIGGVSHPAETRWAEDPSVASVAKKIVAVSLERTGCYGTCPVYVLRFERSRNAIYEGKEYVQREGRYTGRLFGFDRLAYFAAARLLTLEDEYQTSVTDHSTTILTIEMTDGTKRISDYANAGPNDLSIFCTALDGIASSIEWMPEKKANQAAEPTASGRGLL